MDIEQRHKLTFEQAEGVAPLPTQLALGQLDAATIADLWSLMNLLLDQSKKQGYTTVIGAPMSTILLEYHVRHEHQFADEFSFSREDRKHHLKALFRSGNYTKILGFIQFMMRHKDVNPNFGVWISNILERNFCAYQVIDGRTIAPIASEAEGEAVRRAFQELSSGAFVGGRSHLQKAAEALSSGEFAASIRESIHAVDSVARVLAPEARDLGPALSKLQSAGYIHGALKTGFASLYGYASDEKGVRHALIDDANAKVTQADAIYMFGACAAFVTYLVAKAREFGINC